MRVVVETARVLVLGLVLGATNGVVRGWPELPHAEGATCGGPVPAQPEIRWVSQTDARALVDDSSVVFVDARDASEYEAGHVTGALSLPYSGGAIPAQWVAQLKSARFVVAYCNTASGCAQSTRLARALHDAGVGDVRVLEGGMPAWLANNYPAEAGVCHGCP